MGNHSLVYLDGSGTVLKIENRRGETLFYYTENDTTIVPGQQPGSPGQQPGSPGQQPGSPVPRPESPAPRPESSAPSPESPEKNKELDLYSFLYEYNYDDYLQGRDREEANRKLKQAEKLCGSIVPAEKLSADGTLAVKIIDPGFRKDLEALRAKAEEKAKEAEAEAKKALALARRAATLAAKRAGLPKSQAAPVPVPPISPVPVNTPDPEDPKNWEITLHISGFGRSSKSGCLCGTRYCRHTMAVELYFQRKRSALKEAYIRSEKVTDKSYFQSEKLLGLMEDCETDDPDVVSPKQVELLKKTAAEAASVHSQSYVDGILKYMLSMQLSGWNEYDARLLERYRLLIGAFYMDPFLREAIGSPNRLDEFLPEYNERQLKSNVVTFKRELKHFMTAEKELTKGKGEDSLYKQFIVKYSMDGDAFIRYYAETAEPYYGDDLEFLKLYEGNYRRAPVELRDQILKKTDKVDPRYREQRDACLQKMLRSYTPEERAVRLSRMENYHLDLDSYRALSRELREQLAEYMQPAPDILRYILTEVITGYEDRKAAELILKLGNKVIMPGFSKEEGKLLYSAACRLKDHALLSLIVAERFFLKEELPEKQSLALTDGDITSYFRPDFLVREENKSVRTDYYLFNAWEMTGTEKSAGRRVTAQSGGTAGGTSASAVMSEAEGAKLFYKDSVLQFCETGGAFRCESGPEQYLSQESLNRIACLAVKDRQEEIDRKNQEMRDAIEARDFEKNHKHFAGEYKKLCKDLQEEKIVLADSCKASLSYLFDLSGDQILLGFKVGNTRDYIVKDANEFLAAFRSGETVTYGRDLVLTHDIDNLREEDRPVMRLLSPTKFRVTGSGATAKRCLSLTGPVFSNLMELLKGRTVWVGDSPAKVRLDPVEMKLEINEQYELKPDYDPATQRIIPAGTRSFLYTAAPGGASAIDLIKADADQLRLIEFARDNGGVSIRPILNDFKRNVYSRFYDSFRVADRIKADFKLSVIRINAYFDYEDRAVTLRTEYVKDDRVIPRSLVTERMDAAKAEGFDLTVAGLGFEDGVLRDEKGVLSFLKMDFSSLKRQASVYLSEALSSKKLMSLNRQEIRVSCTKSGLIDAVLEKSDFTEEELEEILRAMKRKRKFILLSGDRIIDLDSSEAKEFRDTVKDLGLEAGQLYKKKRLDMVGALKAFAHENSCSIDRQLRSILDEIRAFKDYEVKPPKLSYEMRGYQEEGYRWLSVLSKYNMGGVLADDMGLGKTLQIIALIKADKTEKPSLIVCPKSLVFNWINEFAQFDGETPVTEIYGMPDKRQEIIRGIDYAGKTVYVTSYDSLRNDIGEYTGTFGYCVLDEAQYIKNVTALKSKSVKEIKADHRFALTGTPIENNIIDLWSIFDFIMPGYFEELSEFKASAGQEEFHARVAKRIGPFVLRRVKENVLADLPAKYETILSCEMTDPQRKAYDALRRKTRDIMAASGKAFDLLPMLTRLRQVCVDPAMCIEDYAGGSGKIRMLEELIPRYLEEGHRILLFSQFVKGLNQVEKLLRERDIGYYMLTGDTPAKERSRMIDEFNSTNGTDVFLISLKAGGTGLNLTGADTVIHLDPWWNAAAENQATDRAHRIGQTRNVEVIKLISENSIEQRVIELQNLKKDLIDRVISDDESSVTGARLEDIAYILG